MDVATPKPAGAGPALLRQLLRQPGVWRGNEQPAQQTVTTGYELLDQQLPGGGWPIGALTELMPDREGIGELGLLMPALARISRQGSRRIAWIAPPHLPYAPALADWGIDLERLLLIRPASTRDALWSAEQTLRSGSCSAVLIWTCPQADDRSLRRLQLAAESGCALGFLFRQGHDARRSSPAALRLALHASQPDGLQIEIVKSRGSRSRLPISLPIPIHPHTRSLHRDVRERVPSSELTHHAVALHPASAPTAGSTAPRLLRA